MRNGHTLHLHVHMGSSLRPSAPLKLGSCTSGHHVFLWNPKPAEASFVPLLHVVCGTDGGTREVELARERMREEEKTGRTDGGMFQLVYSCVIPVQPEITQHPVLITCHPQEIRLHTNRGADTAGMLYSVVVH